MTPPFLSGVWASLIWLFSSFNLLWPFLFPHPIHLILSLLPPPSTHCHYLLSPLPPSLSPLLSPTAALLSFPLSDIRLRVRAEYLEHDSVLRNGVSSDKQQPLERQFELFSQANMLLRGRDLGSVICDIKFTELDNLEAFWSDYLKGDLLEALKGVFLTDSLRMAAGREGVHLLISVDQDDYEEGRRRLAAFGPRRRMLSSSNGGRTEGHLAV